MVCDGVLTLARSEVAVKGEEFGEFSSFDVSFFVFFVKGCSFGWSSFARLAVLRVSDRVRAIVEDEDDRLLLVELR